VIAAIRRRHYFRYDHRPHHETYTGAFEGRLAEYFGCRYALACASGTTAITLSLLALDLPAGSPVACPAFTFAATPSAIMLAGHRPVLVECDPDLHIDVSHLREVLTAGASAVVVVHMRGFASDMPAVCAAAQEAGVPVVEDAVPALGVKLGQRHLGTFGVFGAFSTQSDKALNTGEGGFLLSDDTDSYARAVVLSGAYEGRFARHFEQPTGFDDLKLPIFGFRMDEIRAALATAMLTRLPERLALHRRNHDRVIAGLTGVDRIRPRQPVAPDSYLGEALLFRIPGATAAQTAWFAKALRAEGFPARALGDPGDPNIRAFWNWRFLVGDNPAEPKAAFPATTRYVEEAIDIPLSANLGIEDCDELVAGIRKVVDAT
jgi:dTDP-4-amino-4,6-dideoxygalactose transaminase